MYVLLRLSRFAYMSVTTRVPQKTETPFIFFQHSARPSSGSTRVFCVKFKKRVSRYSFPVSRVFQLMAAFVRASFSHHSTTSRANASYGRS